MTRPQTIAAQVKAEMPLEDQALTIKLLIDQLGNEADALGIDITEEMDAAGDAVIAAEAVIVAADRAIMPLVEWTGEAGLRRSAA